jgi:hypothetical protein
MEPTRRNEDMREPQRSRATYDRPGKQTTKLIIYSCKFLDFTSANLVGHRWPRASPAEMYSKFNEMHHILILCGNWPKLEEDPEVRMMRFYTQLPFEIEESLKNHKSLNSQ